jgi:alkyl hydroperoxide reductase subunit AhpF
MPVKLLNDEICKQIKELFDVQLDQPVEIIYFSKLIPCKECDETHQLLEEIISISDKLHLIAYNMDENPQLAQQYKVNLAPGLVIAGRDADKLLDYGIRFAGIPSGYEFSSLIQAITLVSKRDSGLKSEVRSELKSLSTPVNIKVFVTPT